jgi:hypothetical protein
MQSKSKWYFGWLFAGVLMMHAPSIQARPLNDTGETRCSDGSNFVPCSSVQITHPGQDARYGRDVAAGTSALTKSANSFGQNGYEFQKVSNAGLTVAATAPLGGGSNEFACIKDVVTGVTWLLYDILRQSGWRDPNPVTNGGVEGSSGGPNTSSDFAQRANSTGYCGKANWRLPTVRESLSIIAVTGCNGGFADPAFNVIVQGGFWSSQSYVPDPNYAYAVSWPLEVNLCRLTGIVPKTNLLTTTVLVSG